MGAKDLLHTQMFLPHERRLQVKTREEARRIIREHVKTVNRDALKRILKIPSLPHSEKDILALIEKQFTVSYSDKGRLTPGIVAAADLIQFVGRWTQYASRGLIILDLHTPRPEELGADKLAAPAYWGTHWISQHIMPYQEHNLCLLLAGLEPQETVFYPGKAPHTVSLSNYLPSQIAKAASLGRDWDPDREWRIRVVPRFIAGYEQNGTRGIPGGDPEKVKLGTLRTILGAYGDLLEMAEREELNGDSFDAYLRTNEFYTNKLTLVPLDEVRRELETVRGIDVQESLRLVDSIGKHPNWPKVDKLRRRLLSPQAEEHRKEGLLLKNALKKLNISGHQFVKLLEADVPSMKIDVERWQRGLVTIPAAVWTLVEKLQAEQLTAGKHEAETPPPSSPTTSTSATDATPASASSLGRPLESVIAVAKEAANGIFRLVGLDAKYLIQAKAQAEQKETPPVGTPAARAFNRDISLFTRSLNVPVTQNERLALLASDEVLVSHSDAARQVASGMKKNDLLIMIWKDHKSSLLARLKFFVAGLFKIADLQQILLSDEKIASMLKFYGFPENIALVSVSALSDSGDLMLTVPGLDKVKLNLQVLRQKGIDPAQVVALIRQMADHPQLRKKLFYEAGFDFDVNGKFWTAGERFTDMIEKIYAEYAGKRQLDSAA